MSSLLAICRSWVKDWINENPIPDGYKLLDGLCISGEDISFGKYQELALQLEYGVPGVLPETLFLTKMQQHVMRVVEAEINQYLQ